MSTTRLWAAAFLAASVGVSAALAQTPIPPSPKDFVTAASESDQYEIIAGRVAMTQSQDPRVRTFAQKMIEDHTKTSADLRRAAMASGLPAPDPGMSGDQSHLLASLQSVRAAEFDKAYAKQQVLAHAEALAVEQSFATSGADPNLRRAAQSAVPIIQDHLKMAQQLRAQVGES